MLKDKVKELRATLQCLKDCSEGGNIAIQYSAIYSELLQTYYDAEYEGKPTDIRKRFNPEDAMFFVRWLGELQEQIESLLANIDTQ